nr:hypothetical protein [Candidatus Sigynarchaeota archaeon]
MTATVSDSTDPSLCTAFVCFGTMAFALTMTFAANIMEPGFAVLLGLIVGAAVDIVIIVLIDATTGPGRIPRAQYVHRKPHLEPRTPGEIKRRGPAKIEAHRRLTAGEVERLSYNQYE